MDFKPKYSEECSANVKNYILLHIKDEHLKTNEHLDEQNKHMA